MFDFLKKNEPVSEKTSTTGPKSEFPKPKTLVLADYEKMNRAERRRLAKHMKLPMLKGSQKPVINNK